MNLFAQANPEILLFFIVAGVLIGFVIGCALSAFFCKSIINACNKHFLNPRASERFDDPEMISLDPDALVPEPEWGKMLGICVFRALVNLAISIVAGVIFYVAVRADLPRMENNDARSWMSAIGWPRVVTILLVEYVIRFFVGALVLKGSLPTSYKRACVIQLFEYLIYLALLSIGIGLTWVLTDGTMRL